MNQLLNSYKKFVGKDDIPKIESLGSSTIVSISKLCFCKRHHHRKGHDSCVEILLKTTVGDDDFSLGGTYDR